MTTLSARLAASKAKGGRLLVVYLVAGSTPDWLDTAAAAAAHGADALEIGLAFSDPLIDGPVIQAAASDALARGSTLSTVCDELGGRDLGVPLVAMTYCNVLARPGYDTSARRLAEAGVAGALLPDLPLEALSEWHDAARPAGLETVLLAAPSTTPARRDRIAQETEGFLYAVGHMATTGETAALDPAGPALVEDLRHRTSLPICLGVGVSSPAHAAAAAAVADGVVVGSAIVRRMLEGLGPSGVGDFVATLRAALDGGGG